jgi:cation transport regulator
MQYNSIVDLPEPVRNNLPKLAQVIYMKAFNNAWKQYDDPDERRENASREEVAHKVAWSAVKQVYQKRNGKWVRNPD